MKKENEYKVEGRPDVRIVKYENGKRVVHNKVAFKWKNKGKGYCSREELQRAMNP